MKPILNLALILMFLIPAAFASTVIETIPNTSQWGFSRTKINDTSTCCILSAQKTRSNSTFEDLERMLRYYIQTH